MVRLRRLLEDRSFPLRSRNEEPGIAPRLEDHLLESEGAELIFVVTVVNDPVIGQEPVSS